MKIIRVIFVILLVATTANKIFSQNLFEGKLVYTEKITNGFVLQGETTEYYKGYNVVCDMPLAHTKIIYRDDMGEINSINSMMEKPFISKEKCNRASDTSNIVFEGGVEIIKGYHCVKYISRIENEMMKGTSTFWIDTSFKVLYEYGRYVKLQFGLVVKMKSDIRINTMDVQSERELQEIVCGEVDPNIFALPDEDNIIVVTKDEDGNIVLRESDSVGIAKIIEPVRSKNIMKLDDASFEVNTQNGFVLLDFGATWCGPYRIMAPKLDKALRGYRKSIKAFSVDVDECPKTTKKFNVTSVPTVVMLKDGVEIARFIGGLFPENEIVEWIAKNLRTQ